MQRKFLPQVNLVRYLTPRHLRLAAFFLLLVALVTLVLTFRLAPSQVEVTEGQPARETIKAPTGRDYVSRLATEEAKNRAEAAVPPQYSLRESVIQNQRRVGTDLIERVTRELERPEPPSWAPYLRAVQVKVAIKAAAPDLDLSAAMLARIAKLSPGAWRQTALPALDLAINEMTNPGIKTDDLQSVRDRVNQKARIFDFPEATAENQRDVTAWLASSLLQPTYLLDADKTRLAKQAERDKVDPVHVTIVQGETIVRDGDIVTARDIEKLQQLGLLDRQVKWENALGAMLLAALLSLVFVLYLYFMHPHSVNSDRRMLLLIVVVVAFIVAAKLVVPGRDLYSYAFPLAAAPMLVAVLLGPAVASPVALVLALLYAYIAGGSLELVAFALVTGIVGLLGACRATRTMPLGLVGVAVMAAGFVTLLAFRLIGGDYSLGSLGLLLLATAVNGLLSALLTIGTATVLGHLFGLTTPMHLLELADPGQPLLRKLLTEAPGTYHHSIIVGNLAEQAADAIGADRLLVRVGAYYHDIGKTKRPGYFVENQVPGHNIHDQLDPEQSARIIIAHVTDGLEMARAARLPLKVQDFIQQHHGCRCTVYFYHQACKTHGREVDPTPYTYPGPKPQSRETAIVMLADAIEATVRAGTDRSAAAIDKIVDKTIDERITEGELHESSLTLRDLDRLRAEFKKGMKSIYHPRIEYPKDDDLLNPPRRSTPIIPFTAERT